MENSIIINVGIYTSLHGILDQKYTSYQFMMKKIIFIAALQFVLYTNPPYLGINIRKSVVIRFLHLPKKNII